MQLGKMYGTTPGFYLLAGPGWDEEVPEGITRVFRSPSSSGMIAPRIFMDDTAEDRKAIQPVLRQVILYPVGDFNGNSWIRSHGCWLTLLQFRKYGQQLPHHWRTISNEAAFGTDYFTRTAAATSNILVNAPVETKYFYQDLDQDGVRLNGANRYSVTFAKDQTPPVHGFWSLTL